MTSKKTKMAFGVEPSQRRYRLRLARYHALAETIADFCRGKPAGTDKPLDLLDVGVGSGRSMRYIESAGVAGRIQFHGVDLKMRRLDSVYSSDKWDLTCANAEEGLPFKSGNFDIVITEQLLEHLEKPEFVISEAGRILRPGGLLILGVPIFPAGIVSIRRLISKLDNRHAPGKGHIQAFSLGSIMTLVQEIGCFKEMKARGFRIFSGGILAPLEDFQWWYRLNRYIGSIVPSLCTEVQIIAKRK
ncbi:class I SAM-dependent methyltransferase [Verrucomicrobiota bacterium]